MRLPDLLLSNSPSLSEQLRWQTNELLSKIIRANYNVQFALTAPELTDFRHATAGPIHGMDNATLSESFRRTIHLTTYNSYAPLIARFLERPLKASAIINLFSPGLPDFLVESSSTSGGLPKTFPKYNSKIRSSDTDSWRISDPRQRRTRAYIYYLECDRMDVMDDDDYPVATIYLTFGSILRARTNLHLDPAKDQERMGAFISDHAAPYATGFIKKWRSFLLVHVLFAVGSRSLETMNMVFLNTFVDIMRLLDAEFDMVVDSIASGTIPDLDGIAEVRRHLEVNISADPERAAELRLLGRPSSRPGWCGHVWPNLRSIITIASGSFASSIPMARSFLGPNTDICAAGYGCTEVWVGSPYNPLELNQFKPSDEDVFEFLDISKGDSISALAQLWEVELGRRYELVLTTQDGLWRYRLGDVVEISGFDPTDGVPIIQFIERRNVAIRFPDLMISEEELRAAMSSMIPCMLDKIVNWTTTIDDRRIPPTIGFFVEFAGDQATSDLELVPERMLDALTRVNEYVLWALAHDVFCKPTLWLVRPGTFGDFLQLKLDQGRNNLGQTKVPVVLPKDAYVTWFKNQVVQEF